MFSSGGHANTETVLVVIWYSKQFRERALQSRRLGSHHHLSGSRGAFPARNQQEPAPMEEKREQHLNFQLSMLHLLLLLMLPCSSNCRLCVPAGALQLCRLYAGHEAETCVNSGSVLSCKEQAQHP